jgi:hypothetical protein
MAARGKCGRLTESKAQRLERLRKSRYDARAAVELRRTQAARWRSFPVDLTLVAEACGFGAFTAWMAWQRG